MSSDLSPSNVITSAGLDVTNQEGLHAKVPRADAPQVASKDATDFGGVTAEASPAYIDPAAAMFLFAASHEGPNLANVYHGEQVGAFPVSNFEPHLADVAGATDAGPGNAATFVARSGDQASKDNLVKETWPGNGIRTDAIVPYKYSAGDVLTASGVQSAQKDVMLVTVSLSALVTALDSITLPVADLPNSKSVRTTPGAPCFTVIITDDQMRFHLTRHGTTVETVVPVVELTGGEKGEKVFILPDTELFELFPMAKIRDLEHDARPAGPPTEPVVVFEIDPHGPTLAATFGAARIQVRVLPGKAPASITRLNEAAILLDCSVPHALARALGLASTFKLTESRSARQESSPLNVISCANGSVRGGSGEAFTVVTSSCLAPFAFSVHRRDVRVLAHLLRRAGKWTYRAEGSKIQFADGNRVIEVQQPAKDFADIAAMSDKFRTESAGYPVQAMAVMTAGSIQSAAQVSHDPKYPVMTTVAFSDGHDGDIVLRSRSANGWNEALARVAVLGPASSGPTVYTTVALRNLFAAVCTARPDSKIALHATGNALLVVITDDERVVTHILPSSVKPPLTACRCEQDQRQDQDREVLA